MLHPLFERALGHASRYRAMLDSRSPWPALNGAALNARFDGPTPEQGRDALAVIDDLVAAAEPGLAGAAGSRFFGWVIGASHPAGVAADMLTSAWGQNAGNHGCSPAAAVAEQVAGRWLVDMLRLPAESSVGFVTGATMASFTCLAAARNAVLARVGWDVEAFGLVGAPPVRILLGEEAHATIGCALRYLGFGSQATRIAADAEGRMDAGALAAALAAGEGPAIVIAQAGQMNTGAFDPFEPIVRACREHGAWLHVDGAFGLWARVAPELDALTRGVEAADSWAVDGHKWLQLPYDSGFAIVRDAAAHRRAMSIVASYLPAEGEGVYDPAQRVPELSRRARGFAAWALLRHLGRAGVADLVRGHCAFARRAAARLSTEPGVVVLNDVVLNQIIVAFGPPGRGDGATQAVIARLQADTACLACGAEWRARRVLRLSIISGPLTEGDVDRLTDAVLSAWRQVRAEFESPLTIGAPA
ncbi:aminotransferase class V-fold PLP-dependent enzyme [Phenylobacterium sp. LjRoot225]|uniref:pyridoxal phosphate-dependent decarboxylase family protein n=1 Tax=Phenylobacterium sp. LjRoot225 TaxID=3342285 RepID=UPI003ECC208A